MIKLVLCHYFLSLYGFLYLYMFIAIIILSTYIFTFQSSYICSIF